LKKHPDPVPPTHLISFDLLLRSQLAAMLGHGQQEVIEDDIEHTFMSGLAQEEWSQSL